MNCTGKEPEKKHHHRHHHRQILPSTSPDDIFMTSLFSRHQHRPLISSVQRPLEARLFAAGTGTANANNSIAMAEAAKDSKVTSSPRDPTITAEPPATTSLSFRPAPSRSQVAPTGESSNTTRGVVKPGGNPTGMFLDTYRLPVRSCSSGAKSALSAAARPAGNPGLKSRFLPSHLSLH